MKIAIAADHAGIDLKKELVQFLSGLKHEVQDLGTFDTTSVDYPDYSARVARAVQKGEATLGVLVCGTGIGMSIVANKFRGIRAALCSTEFEARMGRAHNDANVLCLGARVLGVGLAQSIAEVFVATAFEGGRHERRIKKIGDAEDENGRA